MAFCVPRLTLGVTRQQTQGPQMQTRWQLERDVPLARYTSLGVGGPARYLANIYSQPALQDALAWSRQRGCSVYILGGGSNVVVSDAGFAGLVIRLLLPGMSLQHMGAGALLSCNAGVSWDAAVAYAVGAGLGGIECLSGIPGSVGAAPVQNIGAYGQELGPALQAVHLVNRDDGSTSRAPAASLGMAYRQSNLKAAWRGRFVVVQVDMLLAQNVPGCQLYPEVRAATGPGPASVQQVREVVLQLRHRKAMVLQEPPGALRSVGSFFINPVVDGVEADRLARLLGARLPRFALPDGRFKVSAAFLLEQAGFARGMRCGYVGLSPQHALCLVAHRGATAHDVVAFAGTLIAGVYQAFRIILVPEPDFVGFSKADLTPLHPLP